jgi:hypothetical protein
MIALFQKCKEDADLLSMLSSPNSQAYKVPKGVNATSFIIDVLKASAINYNHNLKNIVRPLEPTRDMWTVQHFEQKQPQLFMFRGLSTL